MSSNHKPGGIVGYRDERNPTPALYFTQEEGLVRKQAEDLVASIKYHADALRQAEKDLEKLQNNCSHPVFRDESGWPYDFRYCCICKTGMGVV